MTMMMMAMALATRICVDDYVGGVDQDLDCDGALNANVVAAIIYMCIIRLNELIIFKMDLLAVMLL